MLGSTLGIDNWPARWAAKEKALENVDWANFRRDPVLMEGIQTGDVRFELWYERAKAAGIEPRYFEDSRFGDPLGREVDGVFATANSLRMACYANAMKTILSWYTVPTNVLDIGGGYGGMALALRKLIEIDTWFVIDSLPCVQMQKAFIQVPVREFKISNATWVDLVLNTNSFGEMDPQDVAGYFEIIERWLTDEGAFYTVNRLTRVTNFRDYPYGPGWRHVLVRHPVGDPAWAECLSVRDRSANSPHPVEML